MSYDLTRVSDYPPPPQALIPVAPRWWFCTDAMTLARLRFLPDYAWHGDPDHPIVVGMRAAWDCDTMPLACDAFSGEYFRKELTSGGAVYGRVFSPAPPPIGLWSGEPPARMLENTVDAEERGLDMKGTQCPWCGRMALLREDGMMGHHASNRQPAWSPRRLECDGIGKDPERMTSIVRAGLRAQWRDDDGGLIPLPKPARPPTGSSGISPTPVEIKPYDFDQHGAHRSTFVDSARAADRDRAADAVHAHVERGLLNAFEEFVALPDCPHCDGTGKAVRTEPS